MAEAARFPVDVCSQGQFQKDSASLTSGSLMWSSQIKTLLVRLNIGATDATEEAEERLKEAGVFSQRLPVATAFH